MPRRNRPGLATRQNRQTRQEVLASGSRDPSERNLSSEYDAPLENGQRALFDCEYCGHEANAFGREFKADIGSLSTRCPGGKHCLQGIAELRGCKPYQLLDRRTVLTCLGPWLRRNAAGRTRQAEDPEALPTEDVIAWWNDRLLTDPEMRPHRRYLGRVRGLTRSTVHHYGIGFASFHGRAKAFMHPVRDRHGELVNLIESYWPEPMISLATGIEAKARVLAGRPAALMPVEALEPRGDPLLVLTEGRWKVLLLNQRGIRAITSTNGTVWRPEWTPLLAGQSVAVVYDVDAEEKARRRADEFRAAGIDAWPVFLSAAGFAGKDGIDDVVLRAGWTVADVGDLINDERRRSRNTMTLDRPCSSEDMER